MAETSRERVLKTFRHEQPEKLAVDFGSSTSTGISIFAYARLQKYLGINSGELPKLFDIFMMMADSTPEMLDAMGSDVVQLKRYAPYFDIPLKDWKPWTFHDGTQCLVPGSFEPTRNARGAYELHDAQGHVIARLPEKGFYFDRTYFPLADVEEPEELDEIPIPRMSDDEVEYLKRESKRLHEQTDKAVMFPIYARTFEAGMLDFGMQNWLIHLMSDEELVHRYLERLTDQYIRDLDRVLSSCNEYIDFIRFVDDLGTQNSLMMSPETFRRMIKPYMQKMYDFLHTKYPKQYVALHSCGAIRPFIPELIEMGVEILNPIQLAAKDMNAAELKQEFGKKLTFWGGGCDMQNVMTRASIPELKDHVRRMIETLAPGGGFLFAPTHNFQADAAPERILAIYETAAEYR